MEFGVKSRAHTYTLAKCMEQISATKSWHFEFSQKDLYKGDNMWFSK